MYRVFSTAAALILLAPVAARGGEVLVPDPGLESRIRLELEQPDGPLLPEDLATLTALFATSLEITDLTGLEFCTSLRTLFIGSNAISDLGPLSGLDQLETLSIFNNDIDDLSPIAGLSSLVNLDADGNPISDLSPLSSATRLQMLTLSQTSVTDLSPLANLNALESLSASATGVSDLVPIAGLPALKFLRCSDCAVTDLSPIAGASQLLEVVFARNGIESLPASLDWPALLNLGLNGNALSDLAPLAELDTLLMLSLQDNAISDVTPLAGLVELETLNLSGNPIRDIAPLEALFDLQSLSLDDTFVFDLSVVPRFPILINLSLRNARVTDLAPLADNLALRFLDITNNRVCDLSPLLPFFGILQGGVLEASGNPVSLFSCRSVIPQIESRSVFVSGADCTNNTIVDCGVGALFVDVRASDTGEAPGTTTVARSPNGAPLVPLPGGGFFADALATVPYFLRASAPGYEDRFVRIIVSAGESVVNIELDPEGTSGEPGRDDVAAAHSADSDGNGVIELSELLRVAQLFGADEFSCGSASSDGYQIGPEGGIGCRPHAADFEGPIEDWNISLRELLRVIQFYSAGGYERCLTTREDGYCPATINR